MTNRMIYPALLIGALSFGTAAALATGTAAWDLDADGALTPDEFRSGFMLLETHAVFDADGSGRLDETEWEPLAAVGSFTNMDLNADGGVDAEEYVAILFNRYDIDGTATLDAAEAAGIETDLSEGGLLAQ